MKNIYVLIILFAFSLSQTFAAWYTIPANKENEILKNNFESPLWEQAFTINDFKVPFEETVKEPKKKTEVKVAFDGEQLLIKIKAEDKDIANINAAPAPVDPLLNKFPIGDHVELVIRSKKQYIMAFDCNGNKYLSIDYAPAKYCWYELNTRKVQEGWEAIVIINLSDIFPSNSSSKTDITFQAARHTNNNEVERSFAKGRNLLDHFSLHIGAEKGEQ